ncbi:MAG: hypothetical protein M4579_003917 [Chaenotheca gracillima]|nr:MAG: hypothetical protein M4579_003917 [Chaenotheca gracillima]
MSGSRFIPVGDYLSELRKTRLVRPSGSRPFPVGKAPTHNAVPTPPPQTNHAPSRATRLSAAPQDFRSVTATGDHNSGSNQESRSSLSHGRDFLHQGGHPIVQQPDKPLKMDGHDGLGPTAVPPVDIVYKESGSRWMEKQEAQSLRRALQDMDLQGDARLHAAAQNEASELVWRHRNPAAPSRNPDEPYKYKEHLRKGSHARSQSGTRHSGIETNDPRTVSAAGTYGRESYDCNRDSSSSPNFDLRLSSHGQPASQDQRGGTHELWDSPHKKAYINLAYAKPAQSGSNRRRSSGSKSRIVSGGSGRGLFRNPEDQIYEEPEEESATVEKVSVEQQSQPAPLQVKPRNSQPRVQFSRDPPPRSNTAPVVTTSGLLKKQDIHKNPPSQSRNAGYLINDLPLTPPDSAGDSDANQKQEKEGLEIRGEDIRAATSMRLKDRSPRLPRPSIVSDKPGRPIVSFDDDWKPKEKTLKQEKSWESRSSYSNDTVKGRMAGPNITIHGEPSQESFSRNSVPEINISETPSPSRPQTSTGPIPEINVLNVPSIAVDAPDHSDAKDSTSTSNAQGSRRPLPKPKPNPSRPLPHHSATAPAISGARKPMASCTQCQLPIAGRIVSAAGERFHPECFSCFNCGEGLECVAFYPEPEAKRVERVERIRQRFEGVPIEENEGKTAAEDGDEGLRFYCHLDFHEFFSPRCKSCKTPIEGEVVVACGAEWHIGHFFCAECGDPFDSSTPFVEKDGYAWCVNCHTNRYSTKCKRCRRPVTDMVVKALDAEWHSECFCCNECGGQFDDGRFFVQPGSSNPVCVKCEEKRLKA